MQKIKGLFWIVVDIVCIAFLLYYIVISCTGTLKIAEMIITIWFGAVAGILSYTYFKYIRGNY